MNSAISGQSIPTAYANEGHQNVCCLSACVIMCLSTFYESKRTALLEPTAQYSGEATQLFQSTSSHCPWPAPGEVDVGRGSQGTAARPRPEASR